jgi:hypothetical protein
LRSSLSSANQIDIANTPLYCREVTFVKGSTTVNTVVFLWFIYFGIICINTRTLPYLSVNNYFPCRFFAITNESKIILSIEQNSSILYLVNIYRLIHGHFHIGMVIIPRPPYWPDMQSRANMGRGMMTRPIWKCPWLY